MFGLLSYPRSVVTLTFIGTAANVSSWRCDRVLPRIAISITRCRPLPAHRMQCRISAVTAMVEWRQQDGSAVCVKGTFARAASKSVLYVSTFSAALIHAPPILRCTYPFRTMIAMKKKVKMMTTPPSTTLTTTNRDPCGLGLGCCSSDSGELCVVDDS